MFRAPSAVMAAVGVMMPTAVASAVMFVGTLVSTMVTVVVPAEWIELLTSE
jgi:hypothetical protein